MRNFRFYGTLDPRPMMMLLRAHRGLWDLDRGRTAAPDSPHRDASDIILRHGRHDRPPMRLVRQTFDSLVLQLSHRVDITEVVSATIAKLIAGSRIHHHIDYDYLPEAERPAFDRFQVMLQGSAIFNVARETACVEAGDIFWFDNHKLHGVVATGTEPRITLILALVLEHPLPRHPDPTDDVLLALP